MSAPDAYEREPMRGQGAMLHQRRVAAPRWAVALAATVPLALTAIASAALALAGLPAIAYVAPIVAGVLSSLATNAALVVFAVGRVAISEGEVHIRIGPSGPRIPIAEIASCELGPSGIRSRGLGARKLPDGTTLYRMSGDDARAVRMTLRGRTARIVLVCPEPDAVVAAIHEAQRRAAPT